MPVALDTLVKNYKLDHLVNDEKSAIKAGKSQGSVLVVGSPARIKKLTDLVDKERISITLNSLESLQIPTNVFGKTLLSQALNNPECIQDFSNVSDNIHKFRIITSDPWEDSLTKEVLYEYKKLSEDTKAQLNKKSISKCVNRQDFVQMMMEL